MFFISSVTLEVTLAELLLHCTVQCCTALTVLDCAILYWMEMLCFLLCAKGASCSVFHCSTVASFDLWSSVRFVVHHSLSKSIETYYQVNSFLSYFLLPKGKLHGHGRNAPGAPDKAPSSHAAVSTTDQMPFCLACYFPTAYAQNAEMDSGHAGRTFAGQ